MPQAHGSSVGNDSTQRKLAYEMSQARASTYTIIVATVTSSSSSTGF